MKFAGKIKLNKVSVLCKVKLEITVVSRSTRIVQMINDFPKSIGRVDGSGNYKSDLIDKPKLLR